ncbi:tetratricopeptide repeat protein [Sphingomonas immobilis]|uniref:Tetratricopeptide repeat protein n=1 Tax=Sphingomonas immobilis TaxID=3063997 RepID=A0ABT8ZYM3_9SPHN|nr:tetratricopeptide repeat protein [Sphingomonas sp. CA1-15]MDO7842680.1 tetratricopeptide repeat protein [Sphingomonas sp. CA1-15]
MSVVMVAAMLAGAAPADPLMEAAQLVKAGKPEAALPILDASLAGFAKDYAGEKRRIYCGNAPTETIVYMLGAAKDKADAVAIKPDWCEALFLKAFALVDLGRLPEARTLLERAVAMAPMHAHYLNELAYNYTQTREWPRALELYESAISAAEIGAKEARIEEKGRGYRGVGFVRVEQGKWDEAKTAYDETLKLDPNDAKSKGELRYIAENRPHDPK